MTDEFETMFAECPLIAILRGVRPDEVEAIGDALYEGGVRIIEVPLNSPDPLDSIARLSTQFAGRALIGAGTVLRVDQVDPIRAAGGRLIVSPSTNVALCALALTLAPTAAIAATAADTTYESRDDDDGFDLGLLGLLGLAGLLGLKRKDDNASVDARRNTTR